ncbi:SRPBCC domain-containing protein [Flavobacterium sp. 38-13]|uniref:SRPBCC domain-containing protein n=1 Tax=Flavobacterium sp. 38-13 TaxID=1896168 RepID=UPI000B32F687|nr:SRPBCC domain-containing protein [Flavobacterium sp. 38-13]
MKRLFLISATLLMSITAMAKEIKTEIVIQATPEKIWSILTDFENYPNWNPFISTIEGNAVRGNKIKVSIHPPGGKKMTFRPIVITKKDEKELSWRGKVLFRGLFDGEHKFELIDNHDGTVTFIQSEKFKGLFVWMFNPKKTKEGFNRMNEKLKELAEKEID